MHTAPGFTEGRPEWPHFWLSVQMEADSVDQTHIGRTYSTNLILIISYVKLFVCPQVELSIVAFSLFHFPNNACSSI